MPAQPATAKKLYKPQQAAMPTAGKNYLILAPTKQQVLNGFY